MDIKDNLYDKSYLFNVMPPEGQISLSMYIY